MNHAERERLFVELFEGNRASLRRLCYGYLSSASEVDDLFQEIMTNVWNSLPSFRAEAKISTWLYRIAVNTALIHRRKRRPSERRERLDALHRAIARLGDQDRLIVSLLLEGLSYREIADITGITVNYVGVKLSRIKQTLEQMTTEVGHGAA